MREPGRSTVVAPYKVPRISSLWASFAAFPVETQRHIGTVRVDATRTSALTVPTKNKI
jgi:hypothetical protein